MKFLLKVQESQNATKRISQVDAALMLRYLRNPEIISEVERGCVTYTNYFPKTQDEPPTLEQDLLSSTYCTCASLRSMTTNPSFAGLV